jgi:hypothetical protein
MAFADGNMANTSATAQVQILAPVTASADTFPLDFGKVIVQGAGSVSVDQSGTITATAPAFLYKNNTGHATLPKFTITKDSSANVTVTLPTAVAIGTGSFTLNATVVSNTNTFSTSNSTSNGGQAIYGTLAWEAPVPSSGTPLVGTINIAVAYS